MAVSNRGKYSRLLSVLLTTAIATGCLGMADALAQDVASNLGLQTPAPDAKMLLAANELVYNRDAQKVSAIGGVQINYNGYRMVAQRVDYDQASGRMVASGAIELIEPDGNRVYADSLDVTDDFANGFVNALRVETTDNTRFAAESGERVDGREMIFNNGVYTACLPCATRKDKAPLWQVKAERIVQNGETHTIRLERARFELFGQSVAFLPVITVPDQTVKRKSGFLFPRLSLTQNLGFGVSVPYYLVLSNQMDATFTATGYTKQGVLLEGEFRRRFENGLATVRVAGISQMDNGAFSGTTTDSQQTGRFLAASKGDFQINQRWAFGWDVMVQSDNDFAKTYSLNGLDQDTHTSQFYLLGQGERNYFDARGFYFDVQDADINSNAERRQAFVLPNLDYSYYAPEPVAGGELSAKLNFTAITRHREDVFTLGNSIRYRGLKGEQMRLSGETEWKRTFNLGGLLLTPIAAARGDIFGLDVNQPAGYTGALENDAAGRYMVTAGLEARYPLLFSDANSSHILEPIAQVFVRPDEQLAGRLPNEDAQSFVFDTTNLFSRDKFSGYDRVEGGTRANLGFRYTGNFDSGYQVTGIFGQSYQLAGLNSFSAGDLVNAGADSGLETTRSDYVGGAGVVTPRGLSVSANARFDEKDFEVKRTSAVVGFSNRRLQANFIYTQLMAQPDYGFDKDRSELQSNTKIRIDENWSVLGTVSWDIDNKLISKHGLGISYGDECTDFTLSYLSETDSDNQNANDWTIGARLTFRTLGDVNLGSGTLAD